MPLAQSWGEPPPSDTTQSQALARSMDSPASTLPMVGLGWTPSKMVVRNPWAASRSATRPAMPILTSGLSVTTSTDVKPKDLIRATASARHPAPIRLTEGM